MSGLTLTSTLSVSHTVIHGRVLDSQGAQLHVGCVHSIVCCHGDSALELLAIDCATIIRVNHPHPLKSLYHGLFAPNAHRSW